MSNKKNNIDSSVFYAKINFQITNMSTNAMWIILCCVDLSIFH